MTLRPTIARLALLPVLVAALAIAGCGGGGSSTTSSTEAGGASQGGEASSGGSAVTIADFSFKPGKISVPKGTTIVFSNEDETAHTATAKGSEAFDTGAIQPGKSAKVTLDESGTFSYYCAFHPFMKGTIEVE